MKQLSEGFDGRGLDEISAPSMRESDTSSVRDEKDIHHKLSKILHILNEKNDQEEETKEKEIMDMSELQIALSETARCHTMDDEGV